MKTHKSIFLNSLLAAGMTFPFVPFAAMADEPRSADESLVQQIRLDLNADSNLSSDAQQIGIVSTNGDVTLTGRVKTDYERMIVINKAAGEPGVNRVTSHLVTTGNSSTGSN